MTYWKTIKTPLIYFLVVIILVEVKKVEAGVKAGEQDTERITPKLPRK